MSIIEKLEKNERLNYEDAIKLYDLDLFTLASFANKIRILPRQGGNHDFLLYFCPDRYI